MRPGLYAFATAASFLGATIYIGLVEQPARLKLGGPAMLKEWRLSNRRGTATLSVFAVVSVILAFVQFRINRGNGLPTRAGGANIRSSGSR